MFLKQLDTSTKKKTKGEKEEGRKKLKPYLTYKNHIKNQFQVENFKNIEIKITNMLNDNTGKYLHYFQDGK